MDFNLIIYSKLLETLLRQGFSFCTFLDYFESNNPNRIILRHDVDALPLNSLRFARIQEEMGIRGSYYFRVVPGSWDEAVIKEIAGMGHEVGYHYEDLGATAQRHKGVKAEGRSDEVTKSLRDKNNGPHDRKSKRSGDPASAGTARLQDNWRLEKVLVDSAIESFAKNLQRLREIAPVKTICMHGSPRSRWDSRLLWKYYDYRDFGIIGEPYFDVNFDEVMYLTDTGRRWDGEAVSVRDKAQGTGHHPSQGDGWQSRAQGENPYADWKVKPFKYREESGGEKDLETKRLRDERESLSPSVSQSLSPSVSQSLSPSVSSRMPFPKFHSTSDIIRAAENGQLPDKIMMTFHPQRWTDRPFLWAKELVWQNVKNVGKYFLLTIRNR